MNYILTLLVMLMLSGTNANNNISININNLENSKGNILVSVFVCQKDFEDEKAFKKLYFNKQKHMKDGVFHCKINLPDGIYGIVILDDEDSDGDMDYNFIGMPTEGYGFSNFFHNSLSKPKFNDFKFKLNDDKSFNIKLRYF